MKHATDLDIDAANNIVHKLFGGHARPKSIRYVHYYDRYFSYALSQGEISEVELLAVISATDDMENSSFRSFKTCLAECGWAHCCFV